MTNQNQETEPPSFVGVEHYFAHGIITAVKIHQPGGVEVMFTDATVKGLGVSRGIFIGHEHPDCKPALDYLREMGFLHREVDQSLVDKLTKGDSDVE